MKLKPSKGETSETCSTVKLDDNETAVFTVNGVIVQVHSDEGVLKVMAVSNGSKIFYQGTASGSVEIYPVERGRSMKELQNDEA